MIGAQPSTKHFTVQLEQLVHTCVPAELSLAAVARNTVCLSCFTSIRESGTFVLNKATTCKRIAEHRGEMAEQAEEVKLEGLYGQYVCSLPMPPHQDHHPCPVPAARIMIRQTLSA